MSKEFSKFFIAALKRTAQNVYPLVRRKNKIKEELEALNQELDEIQVQIDGYQYPIAQETGGYTTEDLITRVVSDTGKKDKEGKSIKTTQYVLTYPDTIVPPAQGEPTALANSFIEEQLESTDGIKTTPVISFQ